MMRPGRGDCLTLGLSYTEGIYRMDDDEPIPFQNSHGVARLAPTIALLGPRFLVSFDARIPL